MAQVPIDNTPQTFEAKAREALANAPLQRALLNVKRGFVAKRAAARAKLPEFDTLRKEACTIKDHTLAHLDLYLEAYERKVRACGGEVHFAPTAADARAVVLALCRAAGAKLHHVKCHGMLYNMAARDEDLSDAIARAVKDLGPGVILYALSNSTMMAAGLRHGVATLGEVFADRGYRDDGTLTPRDQPGAMITDEAKAVEQALSMVEQGVVRSLSGKEVAVSAGTICLHGDQPRSVAFAQALHRAFAARGISFAAP